MVQTALLVNFYNIERCPNDCNHRGRCIEGICVCEGNWDGPECLLQKCSNDCNGNGICDPLSMKCKCKPGYKGIYCEEKECADSCKNGGKCVDGVCFCEVGWIGKTCEQSKYK